MFLKKAISVLVAAILIVCSVFATPPEGLSSEGLTTLCLFASVIVLWIGDAMPKFIAAFIAMLFLYVLGVADSLDDVWSAFISSVFFFLIAAFAMADAVKHSTIPMRVMRALLRLLKRNTSLIVLAFMFTSAVVSSVMSDLAACALIASIAISVTQKEGIDPAFKKCLLIGVPIGSLAGGYSTPIGSPTNITLMGIINSFGIEIGFTQWMIVGVPLSFITVVIAWVFLLVAFRPKQVTDVEGG